MSYCCKDFEIHYAEWRCDQHSNRMDCPDAILVHTRTGLWGIPIHDGGSSFIQINYCPFCGAPLYDWLEDKNAT